MNSKMNTKINLFSDLERSSSNFNDIEIIDFDELKNSDCSKVIGSVNSSSKVIESVNSSSKVVGSSCSSYQISSSYENMTECHAKLIEKFNNPPIEHNNKSNEDNLFNEKQIYQSINRKIESIKDDLSINEPNEQNNKSINEEILILKVSLKNQLINLYTDISSILLGECVQDKLFLDTTREKFYELFIDLGSLYLKSSLEDNIYHPEEEILELNSKLRIHLIDNLIKNRTFYLDLNKYSNDEKKNLAESNKKLIFYLNNLPAINYTFDPKQKCFNEQLKKQTYENQSRYPDSFTVKNLAYRTKESEAMIEDWFAKNRILENLKTNSKFIPTCSLNSFEDDKTSEYCLILNSSINRNEANEKQLISNYMTNLSNKSLSEISGNTKNQFTVDSNEKLSEIAIKNDDLNQNIDNHSSANTLNISTKDSINNTNSNEVNSAIKSESKNLIKKTTRSSSNLIKDSSRNSKDLKLDSTTSSSKNLIQDSTIYSTRDSARHSTRYSIRSSKRDSKNIIQNVQSNNPIEYLDHQINKLMIKSNNDQQKNIIQDELKVTYFDNKFNSIDNNLDDLKNSVTKLETLITDQIIKPNINNNLNTNDQIEFYFRLKKIDTFFQNATSCILKLKCSNLDFNLELISSKDLNDSYLNFALHYQNIDHNNNKHLVNAVNRIDLFRFDNSKKAVKTYINYIMFQTICKSTMIKIISLKDLNKLGLIKNNSIKLKYTLNAKLIEK